MGDPDPGQSSRLRTPWTARLARLQPWYLLVRYPNRGTRAAFAFVNACISIGIMTVAAVYTGEFLVFPSLGPTAFLFFHQPTAPAAAPRSAILSHGTGLLVGWLFYAALGIGNDPSAMEQVAAVALSLGTISAVMILLAIGHPPAAATTLFVSLGTVTLWNHLLSIWIAVILLTAQAYIFNRLSGVLYPLWKPLHVRAGEGPEAAALHTPNEESRPADVYGSIADALVHRRKPK